MSRVLRSYRKERKLVIELRTFDYIPEHNKNLMCLLCHVSFIDFIIPYCDYLYNVGPLQEFKGKSVQGQIDRIASRSDHTTPILQCSYQCNKPFSLFKIKDGRFCITGREVSILRESGRLQ